MSNPHGYEARFTIEQHLDELIERLGKAIKQAQNRAYEIGRYRDVMDETAAFLVGNGDVAELAATRLRRALQANPTGEVATPEGIGRKPKYKCGGTSDGQCVAAVSDAHDCSAPSCLVRIDKYPRDVAFQRILDGNAVPMSRREWFDEGWIACQSLGKSEEGELPALTEPTNIETVAAQIVIASEYGGDWDQMVASCSDSMRATDVLSDLVATEAALQQRTKQLRAALSRAGVESAPESWNRAFQHASRHGWVAELRCYRETYDDSPIEHTPTCPVGQVMSLEGK